MIEMPEIATTKDVAAYLKKKPGTIYNWKSAKLFLPGIVLANGDFNITKLKRYIQDTKTGGAYLTTHLKAAA